MIVVLNVGHAIEVEAIALSAAEADDGICLPAMFIFAHEDYIAELDVRDGHLDRIQEVASNSGKRYT